MRSRVACLALVLAVWPAFAGATADPSPDVDANVVFLRSDCDVDGAPMENCFESMTALSDPASGWIWNTRTPAPSASDSLLVDVGPGTFGPFKCDAAGFVTVRGAGREQTILADGINGGVQVTGGCDDLSFIDIGLHGGVYGVQWIGNGSASWSNVDIAASGEPAYARAAWIDDCDYALYQTDPSLISRSTHYFHGSRIRTFGSGTVLTTAFWSKCADNWFFGGEILVDHTSYSSHANAVNLGQYGELRVFGTPIRVRAEAAAGTGVTGVSVALSTAIPGTSLTEGSFHSHGSIVNVDAGSAPVDVSVIGLSVGASPSFAHTPGTAFVVKPGGAGSATRVDVAAGGVAMSPFLWQDGDTPPAITSQHGSDIFVERDCDATDCSGGSDPHLMIYSDACAGAGGPWFDVVRAACRQ